MSAGEGFSVVVAAIMLMVCVRRTRVAPAFRRAWDRVTKRGAALAKSTAPSRLELGSKRYAAWL
jgi:hypothetical protein